MNSVILCGQPFARLSSWAAPGHDVRLGTGPGGPGRGSGMLRGLGLLALLLGAGWSLELQAGAVQPTPEEAKALKQLGLRLPAAKLLWVNRNRIYFSPISDWQPRMVSEPGQTEMSPRWSPDGTRIVFARAKSGVWIMNADFSEKELILPGAHTPSWTRDGTGVTAISADGYCIVRHTLKTEQTQTLYDAREKPWNGQVVSQAAELHPSGRYLLTFRRQPRHVTEIIDLKGKRYLANREMLRGDCSPSWSPDGKYLIMTARTGSRPVLKADFDPATGKLEASKLFAGLGPQQRFYIHGQHVSNDGDWVVAGGLCFNGPRKGGHREIYAWKVSEPPTNAVRLTFDSGEDKSPDLFVPGKGAKPPAPCTNLQAQVLGSDSIRLAWEHEGTDESGFHLERSRAEEPFKQVASTIGNVLTFSDAKLKPSTIYSYRVRAFSEVGPSSWSNQVTETTDPAGSQKAVFIASPVETVDKVVEGAELTLEGNGEGLKWKFAMGDPNSDSLKPLGGGPSVLLEVPEIKGKETKLTLVLEGKGGRSERVLTVVPPPDVPTIRVLTPNGKEVLRAGAIHTIQWDALLIEDVTISFSADGGKTWQRTALSVDISHRHWRRCPWKVPNAPSGRCLIKVKDYLGDTEDVSDAVFSIKAEQ